MTPAYQDERLLVYQADVREVLPELETASVDAIVTSPPYWQQRAYAPDGSTEQTREIGLEPTFDEWVRTIVEIAEELRRVLRPTGSLWLNVGDRYKAWGGQHRVADPVTGRFATAPRGGTRGYPAGLRRKSLLLAPYRLAIALCDAGWILRDEVVWAKTNALPESVGDRLSRRHEVFFRFTQTRYDAFNLGPIRVPVKESTIERTKRAAMVFGGAGAKAGGPKGTRTRSGKPYTLEDRGSAVVEPEANVYRYKTRTNRPDGANPGNVWSLATASREGARFDHFAMFPAELVVRPILSTVPEGGVVLDPFAGTGTVGDVANRLGRRAILVELNPASVDDILRRTARERLEPIDWRALELADPDGEAADPVLGLWEAVR